MLRSANLKTLVKEVREGKKKASLSYSWSSSEYDTDTLDSQDDSDMFDEDSGESNAHGIFNVDILPNEHESSLALAIADADDTTGPSPTSRRKGNDSASTQNFLTTTTSGRLINQKSNNPPGGTAVVETPFLPLVRFVYPQKISSSSGSSESSDYD